MTAKEFAQLTAAIKTYYPRDNVLPTQESMELWFDSLKNIDYQNAVKGLKKYVENNRFAPAISDIREYAEAHKQKVLEIEEKHVGVPAPENLKQRLKEVLRKE